MLTDNYGILKMKGVEYVNIKIFSEWLACEECCLRLVLKFLFHGNRIENLVSILSQCSFFPVPSISQPVNVKYELFTNYRYIKDIFPYQHLFIAYVCLRDLVDRHLIH